MKRLFLLLSLVVFLSCTNDEQKESPVSSPANSSATDTGGRGDTASYERMPQQTNDSVGK